MVSLLVFVNGDRGITVLRKLLENSFRQIVVVFLSGSQHATAIKNLYFKQSALFVRRHQIKMYV